MAGSSDPSDNPVGINVVPMVDVIFCLCLFFMCSLKFKQLEGRIEAWLPDKHGNQVTAVQPPVFDQIRVMLRWDGTRTIRKVGHRETPTDLDFAEALHRYPKNLDLAVAIDATADVPWRDAVHALELCRRNRYEKVEFVEPLTALQSSD